MERYETFDCLFLWLTVHQCLQLRPTHFYGSNDLIGCLHFYEHSFVTFLYGFVLLLRLCILLKPNKVPFIKKLWLTQCVIRDTDTRNFCIGRGSHTNVPYKFLGVDSN
jgi:hypothetical protein